MPDDFDSPWKDILDGYFPDFMAFFFPQAAAEIDWSRGFETLDKELAQAVRDAELGRRFADKLIRVFLLDGSEEWLLVHIEVQGQHDAGLAKRMFVYAYRLYDRYNHEIVSLAVLADTVPGWRPEGFTVGRWGSWLGISFPSVKLLEYAARQAELEADENPFATVVLAHLAAQATRDDDLARYERKLSLTRRLYERGLTRQRIIDLYRFIDWILRLPDDLQYTDAILAIEEKLTMPYVTFVERRGEARGSARLLRGLLEPAGACPISRGGTGHSPRPERSLRRRLLVCARRSAENVSDGANAPSGILRERPSVIGCNIGAYGRNRARVGCSCEPDGVCHINRGGTRHPGGADGLCRAAILVVGQSTSRSGPDRDDRFRDHWETQGHRGHGPRHRYQGRGAT